MSLTTCVRIKSKILFHSSLVFYVDLVMDWQESQIYIASQLQLKYITNVETAYLSDQCIL